MVEPLIEWAYRCQKSGTTYALGFAAERSVMAAHRNVELGVMCPVCKEKHYVPIADLFPAWAFTDVAV